MPATSHSYMCDGIEQENGEAVATSLTSGEAVLATASPVC